ncbi:MAG: DUF1257 domain-containing protein [Chloroflexota bacterium]
MSKFVQIQTTLQDLTMIKQSLDDLEIHYSENRVYNHRYSTFKGQVPILVKHNRLEFGLRETEDEVYEVIGDDMQLRGINKLMEGVQQRYAYHKVKTETEKAGFVLVEENTGRDNVIRMTVRRWS